MTQFPIRHILFPYDYSEQGRQIAPFVAGFSRQFGSKLTVFSVAPPGKIEDGLGEEFADIPTQWVTTCGDPALRIADFAHNRDVDLVMMPTHGLGLYRRVLAGSVTSKVLHDVRYPVWTAAHAERQSSPLIPRTILCAVDSRTEGVPLLQYAALFSKRVGACLKVLHVAEPVTDWPSLERERALQEQARDIAAQAVASMLDAAGVQAQSKVVVGEIVARATEAAREERADLLVVGRGSLTEPFGMIRTHAFGIIERSPCPVLSV
jgi:nucleotide-binding universal stress UspA family protein